MQVKAGERIELFLDSHGGDAAVGTSIADKIYLLRTRGVHVKCVAIRAISAAFMIWITCDERVALAYGKFLFHYPFTIVHGSMRAKDYIDGVEAAKLIEAQFKARWNVALTPYVSLEAQEKAATEEIMFSGINFCTVFTKGFCTVIYRYEHLEGK